MFIDRLLEKGLARRYDGGPRDRTYLFRHVVLVAVSFPLVSRLTWTKLGEGQYYSLSKCHNLRDGDLAKIEICKDG